MPQSQGQGPAYAGPRALPFTGAAAGPMLAPAPLPLAALTGGGAPGVPEYSISRTIQTIPEL